MAISYREAMVNYYVNDVEGIAAFYRQHFGFVESFCTTATRCPIWIFFRLPPS